MNAASRLTKSDANRILSLARAYGEANAAQAVALVDLEPATLDRFRQIQAGKDEAHQAMLEAVYALVDWRAELGLSASGEAR